MRKTLLFFFIAGLFFLPGLAGHEVFAANTQMEAPISVSGVHAAPSLGGLSPTIAPVPAQPTRAQLPISAVPSHHKERLKVVLEDIEGKVKLESIQEPNQPTETDHSGAESMAVALQGGKAAALPALATEVSVGAAHAALLKKQWRRDSGNTDRSRFGVLGRSPGTALRRARASKAGQAMMPIISMVFVAAAYVALTFMTGKFSLLETFLIFFTGYLMLEHGRTKINDTVPQNQFMGLALLILGLALAAASLHSTFLISQSHNNILAQASPLTFIFAILAAGLLLAL